MRLKNNQELIIRDIQVSDAEDVLAYMKKVNSETQNLLREPDEFTMTVEQEKEFIETNLKSDNHCMIVGIVNNQIISVSGFYGTGLKRNRHRVTLGTSVVKEYHGQGVGSYMMEALIKRARAMGKTKIDLDVRVDNYSAIRLYKRYGFKIEGTIRHGFFVDNHYVDLYQMGLILEE